MLAKYRFILLFGLALSLLLVLYYVATQDKVPTQNDSSAITNENNISLIHEAEIKSTESLQINNNNTDVSTHEASSDSPKNDTPTTIVSCPYPEDTEEEITARQEKIKHFAQARIKDSTLENAKVAYFFNLDPQISSHQKRLFIQEYLQAFPNDKLGVHQLLNACTALPHDPYCTSELATSIEQADPDNGLLWLQLASLMHIQDKQSDMLHFLNKANVSSNFSNYFYEYIDLFFEQAYGELDLSFNDVYALGAGMVSTANISLIVSLCKNMSLDHTILLQQCQQLGNSLQTNANDLLIQSLGAAISRELYKQTNDTAALNKQISIDQARYEAMFNAEWQQAQALLSWDEELMMTWITHGKTFGEQGAIKALVKEAKLKSLNPDYQPCKQ